MSAQTARRNSSRNVARSGDDALSRDGGPNTTASESELRAALRQRERERDALARADAALYGSLRLEDIFEALFDVAADVLEALYRADADLHRSLRLDEVLQTLVDLPVEIGQSEMVSLLLWDERQRRFVVGGVRGLSDVMLSESFTLAEARIARASQTELVEITDADSDDRISDRLRRMTTREGVRAWLSSPIRIGGRLFGSFSFGYGQPHAFTDRERRLLIALSQRAALAIQNARLFEQAQQAAALEERQRLARELHDAVTQTLFSASLIAEVTPRLWDRNPEEGRRRLEELRQLTRGALAEMRSLLLELRPSALTEVGLETLLRQLGEAAASRSQLRVELETDGDARALPPDVQVTLYRLAQKSLNNVARHARARSVKVRVEWQPDNVRVRIEDDGCGFDPASVSPGHLGLGIMRERASSVGAILTKDSRPGEGTRVTIEWAGRQAAAQ